MAGASLNLCSRNLERTQDRVVGAEKGTQLESITSCVLVSSPSPFPAPRPVSSPQTSPQRIPLDVPQNHQKVFVLLDRKGLESTLPDVAGGVIMLLVAADVGREQSVHPAAQVSIP